MPNTNRSSAVDNDHQKSVQGKNQSGPADKVGKDAGGNEGSKGHNIKRTGSARQEPTGKQSRDHGDERHQQGGSGGGQGNRQNKEVNRGGRG